MAKRGDAAALASKLGTNRSRTLTVKQVRWLRDVAGREMESQAGTDDADRTVYFLRHGLCIKDAEGRDHAELRIYPNGAGWLRFSADERSNR